MLSPHEWSANSHRFRCFFGSLILVMVVGLWAGRKEESTEDFYLAGRGVPVGGALLVLYLARTFLPTTLLV